MLVRNQGIDIVKQIGKITTKTEAMALFESKLAVEEWLKIKRIKHPEVLIKIANTIIMCEPEKVFVNSGSKLDRQYIRDLSIKNGEEAPLAMEKHTVHFDLKEEQGRIIDRTFYIVNDNEHTNSLAGTMTRNEALQDISKYLLGLMKGQTMIIGFYVRGPADAPVSNPALELTSSAYVSHSAEILYRNAFEEFDQMVENRGHFFTNIHCQGLNRPQDLPNARVLMDRSHQTTYSFNCTYAGNSLMLKKGNHRFAVDKAVYENRGEELAEHMFITGLEGPGGRTTYFVGAAPSGCGKTTTAMTGNRLVGDDLAQLWIDENGAIRTINPEFGIFGILEDVNREGDPILIDKLRNPGTEVIWSNVLIDENNVPHWTGNGEPPPTRGKNFHGIWETGTKDENGIDVPVSHPNSRCTLALTSLDNYCKKTEDPAGVETQIVTFSGRDSDTMPPVWAAKNTDHGVIIGACIVSAATATEVGATGIKRNPWANALFIPGALGDYMDAQFKFFSNKKIPEDKKPIIAGLNYFLTDEARGGTSKRLLGEKKDVKVWLSWLERLVHREVGTIETPIGFLPKYGDLQHLFKTIINKVYPEDLYIRQFSLYLDNIIARKDLQIKAYRKEEGIPQKFFDIMEEQKRGLIALKEKHGVSVVTPYDL